MRRIQIYIEEKMDERLQADAVRTGRSKASLIRESIAAWMGRPELPEEDALTRLVGSLDCEPGDVDKVVYGS